MCVGLVYGNRVAFPHGNKLSFAQQSLCDGPLVYGNQFVKMMQQLVGGLQGGLAGFIYTSTQECLAEVAHTVLLLCLAAGTALGF